MSRDHTDQISGEREGGAGGGTPIKKSQDAIETTQLAMDDNTMYFDLSCSLVSKAHYILWHVSFYNHC